MSRDAQASGGTDLERYLSDTFVELCRTPSPSGQERACAERVRAELGALGVHAEEDAAGDEVDSDCGNLLARVPGAAASSEQVATGGQAAEHDSTGAAASGAPRRSLLLCAHLDTVPLQAPVDPVLVEGFWENANDGILGADNKAAIALVLAIARHVRAHGAPVDLELLFTVREETGLAGARAFDASRLRSDFGYVFDHASPVGEVIVGSPSHYRIDASFHGAAAHAGIRPEDGRSAIVAAARAVCGMRLGRVDEQTTANVGTIHGGSALNVVPERCSLLAEVRSLDEERAEALVGELVDRIHQAANAPECDCDVDVTVQRLFAGYRLAPGARAVQAAESALRACGHEPRAVRSGGGSDANALLAQGFETVNLANGTERNHEPGERVSAAALQEMLAVGLALLGEAALAPSTAR